MFLAVGAILFTAVSVAIAARLREARINVQDFIDSVDQNPPVPFPTEAHVPSAASFQFVHPASSPAGEAMFTESLLALSKVGLRARSGSPAPAPVEASSLESVHHDRSKTRDQAL